MCAHGGHALVHDGETILRDHGSPGQSQGRRGGDVLRIEPEVSGSEAVNLRHHHEWMRQECSGPFTSLAVLDDNTLLVVGRQKQGNRRVEVLFLLQRVASDWWCWPLLTEGVEKKGVVLRCFRGVWGASGQGSRDGVLQNSCWIWGLCSSTWGWQDRQWKLTWDVSVRPVQVKVELTDLQSGGFSIPTELESFSLKQLDRRGLLKTGVEQHLQKSLIPAVGQSRPQQSCSNALAAKVRCDPQPAHLCHIGLPILGDDVYRTSGRADASPETTAATVTPEESQRPPRMMLHALSLQMDHPVLEGRRIGAYAEPPADFTRLLGGLELGEIDFRSLLEEDGSRSRVIPCQ